MKVIRILLVFISFVFFLNAVSFADSKFGDKSSQDNWQNLIVDLENGKAPNFDKYIGTEVSFQFWNFDQQADGSIIFSVGRNYHQVGKCIILNPPSTKVKVTPEIKKGETRAMPNLSWIGKGKVVSVNPSHKIITLKDVPEFGNVNF